MSNDILFYFGSHNFSMAAWGSLEKNDSQVSMANYELGIIFNPVKLRFQEKQNILKSFAYNLNSGFYKNEDKPFLRDDF